MLGFVSILISLVWVLPTGLEAQTHSTESNSWSNNGPYGGYLHSLTRSPSNLDIIYAGTEGGVFKSTNNSASWARTGHPVIPVYAVKVNPTEPQTIIVGSEDGVYKSGDGGDT